MNKAITREEAKIDCQEAHSWVDDVKVMPLELVEQHIDKIYDSFEQNTLTVTKKTVANLSTRMEEGKEYEVIIREVGNE